MALRERVIAVEEQTLNLKGQIKDVYGLIRGLNQRNKECQRRILWLYGRIRGRGELAEETQQGNN